MRENQDKPKVKGCGVYRLGMLLSSLRTRLRTEELSELERKDVEEQVREIEKALDV